jgi:hypothetical protein
MAKTKYGKHVIKGPFLTIDHYTGPSLLSHEGEFDADVCIGYHCLADTRYKAEFPHTHDFHELLCFIGGNPKNIKDFGAEIEITLGEERSHRLHHGRFNPTRTTPLPADSKEVRPEEARRFPGNIADTQVATNVGQDKQDDAGRTGQDAAGHAR